jgi:hypothetical protein
MEGAGSALGSYVGGLVGLGGLAVGGHGGFTKDGVGVAQVS